MVKHPAFNRLSGGSSPPSPTKLLAYSNQGECARLLTENEVGSIPTTPAKLWFRSSIGRALVCHTRGSEIETRRDRQFARKA